MGGRSWIDTLDFRRAWSGSLIELVGVSDFGGV